MKNITLLQPQKTVFGTGCISQFPEDYLKSGYKKLFVITMPIMRSMTSQMFDDLSANGIDVKFYEDVHGEPSITDFKKVLKAAEDFDADSFLGIGGGSILDLTKLVATLLGSSQQVEDLFGTGLIERRGKWFACVPTTAGTGSEMSPNAILLDERDEIKKGVADNRAFCTKLTEAIKNKHGLTTKGELLEFFVGLEKGSYNGIDFSEFTNIKMKDKGKMAVISSWWPVNIIDSIGSKIFKGKWKGFCRGNLGDSLIKFNVVNGSLADTKIGSLVQKSITVPTE